MRRTGSLLAGIALTMLPAHASDACTARTACVCRPVAVERETLGDTLAVRLAWATVAIRGEVVRQEQQLTPGLFSRSASGDSIPEGPIVAHIRVLQRWKGSTPDTIVAIISPGQTIVSTCPVFVSVGAEYILFLGPPESGRFRLSACGGVRKTWPWPNDAAAALDSLTRRH